MDTESPVVWPAWCYSGDTTTSALPDSSPLRPALATRPPRRRDSRVDRSSGPVATPVDYHPHHNNNNNNNHVKSERLSPGTPEAASSRSRSGTPGSASHPDTPPAAVPTAGVEGMLGRNYSDFMRSLAAKYNNANPNDYFSAARNGFPPPLDARFKPATFPNLLPLPPHQNKDTTTDLVMGKKPSDFAVLNPFAGAAAAVFPPLIDMSTTQTLLAMVRTAKEAELQGLLKNVKRPDSSSPLDLSSAGGPPAPKRPRIKTPSSLGGGSPNGSNSGAAISKRAGSESPKLHEDVSSWTVDDVCNFVSGIDICAEYAQTFREQRIDGAGLPLLTEEHLTTTMCMKLGPALKLRSMLARKLGSCALCLHCSHCHAANQTTASSSPDAHNNSSDSSGAAS